ncbi:MAG: hypothetical protein FWF09_04760 [Bacteroidales bacterium]|nr:hypothetical protein [Bacteroidales bacterium]
MVHQVTTKKVKKQVAVDKYLISIALILLFFAACLILTSCDDIPNVSNISNSSNAPETPTVSNTSNTTRVPSNPIEVTISGTISHTDYTPGASGTVTFNRFPATVAEFKQVREQIGGEPHGAVALQLMAYEMYRRNKTTGNECVRLNSVLNNVDLPIRRMNELFHGNDAYYARPYQIAAFLNDATPDNGYNPSKPYTVEVRVNKGLPYRYSQEYQTDVLYLEVLTKGKSTGAEGVQVLKTHKPGEPSNGKYFTVFSCGGLFSSVQAVSFTSPFKGLD